MEKMPTWRYGGRGWNFHAYMGTSMCSATWKLSELGLPGFMEALSVMTGYITGHWDPLNLLPSALPRTNPLITGWFPW
jgi:hypothetical protein